MPTDADFAASARRALFTLASWTNFIFDGGAGSRLLEVPVDPSGIADPDLPFGVPRAVSARLDESVAFSALMRARAFTETGVWEGSAAELRATNQALAPLYGLIDSDGLSGPYDDALLDPSDRGVLLSVMLASWGRESIARGESVTISVLAAVAGLKEKTVRMAAVGQSGTPSLRTVKEGARVLVEAHECARWLRERRGFRPTVIKNQPDAINLAPRSSQELALTLESLRQRAGLTVDEVADRIGLSERGREVLVAIEDGWTMNADMDFAAFDVARVTDLARVLGVERPVEFVRAVSGFLTPFQIQQQMRRTGRNG